MKKKFPKKGELVLCIVKRILPHCAFVEMEEYGKEGMLHISEIASRGVKDIRDYLQEGKRIVCKVFKVDERKGFIDVSLKRVKDYEKKKKLDEWRAERRVIGLIEYVAKKIKSKNIANKLTSEILKEYESLSDFFKDLRERGIIVIDELKIEENIKKEFKKVIQEQIKVSSVKIKKVIELSSTAPDGIERIKKVISNAIKEVKKDGTKINVEYLSAPKYSLEVSDTNYKKCERTLDNFLELVKKFSKQEGVNFEAGV